MKIKILGLLFVVCVFGAGVYAQTVSPSFFGGIDHPVAESPCGLSPTISASPFVYNDQVWLTYLCGDNRVIMRAFPVITKLPPAINECSVHGLYPSKFGGCVDFYHPHKR